MALTEEEDMLQKQGLSPWKYRLLVLALYLSVGACLAAIWLTGTLFGSPAQLIPFWLQQLIAVHRIPVLAFPFACLVACYGLLRSITGEITAVPERFLDERQKMIRDQAHRSAFRFIKLACLLIPALLLLQYLPWLQQPKTPAVYPPVFIRYVVLPSAHPSYRLPNGLALQKMHTAANALINYQLFWGGLPAFHNTLIAPASTVDIILAAAVLLLSLFLLVSALPMSVIAWKRRA